MSEIQVREIEKSEMTRDVQTVTVSGQPTQALPHGVTFYETPTQVDERGSLFEIFNPAWGWSSEPLVQAYAVTIRPGVIKGWAMHKTHQDRYYIISGSMEVVLYDARPDSPTYGLVSQIVLSEFNRRLMNIPIGVWHADHNICDKEVLLMNFPTLAYDHENPDKYRLPLDTDQIPFKFKNPNVW